LLASYRASRVSLSRDLTAACSNLAVVSLFRTLSADIRLGKRVKNQREEDRGGDGEGILYG